jgi:hypothetical protein
MGVMYLNRKLLALALIVIFTIPFLGGCTIKIKQIDNLMRPPLLEGEYHDLQIAFNNAVGNDIILKAPQSGEFRSAYVLYDIDGDNENEAVVFYINREDKTVAHMNVLDKEDNNWVSIADIEGSGSDIKAVEFTEMNGDMFPEIIVSWSLYDNEANKILSVFECSKVDSKLTVKEISTEPFNIMKPIDVDSDGNNEIFLIRLDTSSEVPQSYAKMLKMQNDGSIKLVSQIKLDGNIESYAEIKAEKVSEDYPMRIYIDANKGATQMITEVVFWDKQKHQLVDPMLNEQTQSNIITWRSTRIPSMDINNDGIIEIPTQTIMPGSILLSKDTESMPIYLTKWLQISNTGTAFEVMQSVINFTDNYMFILPSTLSGKITINNNIIDKQWDVYSYTSVSKPGEMLFSIRAVPVSKWIDDKTIYNGYTKIINNSGMVVGAYISPAGKDLGIDYKFLKQYIVAYEGG